MPYIGNTVQNQGFAPAIDYFSGNGVTVTFTLSRNIASVAQIVCAIDNVIQNPSSAFTVSGNSITFTSAPLAGTNNIWVEYTSLITTYAAISQSPSVIGDLTASGGYLAVGSFGNSFIDGTIVDYTTGNGRITVGPADGLTLYTGGTSARSALATWDQNGNLTNTGNLGVGATPSSEWAAGQFSQVTGVSTYSVASLATTRTVADGNRIGSLTFEMPNNTATYKTRAVVEAIMTGSTANKYGAYLAFSTAADNTQNPTERFRISSTSANIILAGGTTTATGTGITFPATQAASSDPNCLDDYEEGTWSPAFVNFSGTAGWTFSYPIYVKIGRTVYISCQLTPGSGTISSTANSSLITGIPFNVTGANSPIPFATNYIETLGSGVIYGSSGIYSPTFSVTNAKAIFFAATYQTTT